MSDPISRQQAITALRALSDEDGYINAPHEVVTDVVRGLPPVRAEHEQTTQPEQTKTDKLGVKAGKTYTDTISRKAAIDIIEDFPHGGVWNVESMEEMVYRIKQLPSAHPDLGKYEYHYDHTDCIWYRPEARNRCPSTCAQYRDGWNDAMNYIFRDGKGYRPYRRDRRYEDGDTD